MLTRARQRTAASSTSCLRAAVLVLAFILSAQEGDGSPSYVAVVSPVSSFRQIAADLITGWNNEISESQLDVVQQPSDGCALDSNAASVRNRAVFVNLARGSCDYLQRATVLQDAGASTVFFWHSDRDVTLPSIGLESSLRSLLTIPLFGVSRTDGLTVDGVLAVRQMRISLPVTEPQTCLRIHTPTISTAALMSSPTASSRTTYVMLSGTFPGNAASCWFFTLSDKDSPCLQTSSTDPGCRALSSPATSFNSSTIVCQVPAQISIAAIAQYRITLEAVHTSASLVTARCFSHQHMPILMWSRDAYAQVSAASVNSTTLPPEFLSTPPCACSIDGRSGRVDATGVKGCATLLQNSSQLWCFVQDPERCTYATPSLTISGAAARPCYAAFPGADSSLCDGACRGSACSPEGICTCFDGWVGKNCTTALCPDGCIEGQGECSSPDVCTCLPGWSGSSCHSPICPGNCSGGNGVCYLPSKCLCRAGFGGSDCSVSIPSSGSDDTEDTGSGRTTTVIVAAVLSTLLIIAVIYLIFGREGSTTVILQSAPDGADLGPLVSRVVTTKRSFLWCSRTVEREEDFFESNPHHLRERRSGLLPSYNDTIRVLPAQFELEGAPLGQPSSSSSSSSSAVVSPSSLFREHRRFASTHLSLPEEHSAQDALLDTASVRSLPPPYASSDPLRDGQGRRDVTSTGAVAPLSPTTPRDRSNGGAVEAPHTPLPPLQPRSLFGPPPALRPLTASTTDRGTDITSSQPPFFPASLRPQRPHRHSMRPNTSTSSIAPLLEPVSPPTLSQETSLSEGPLFLPRTPSELRFPPTRPMSADPSSVSAAASSSAHEVSARSHHSNRSSAVAPLNPAPVRRSSSSFLSPQPPTEMPRLQRRSSRSSTEALFPLPITSISDQEDGVELSVHRIVQSGRSSEIPFGVGLQPMEDAQEDLIQPVPRPRLVVEENSDEQEASSPQHPGGSTSSWARRPSMDSGVELPSPAASGGFGRQKRRKRLRPKGSVVSAPSHQQQLRPHANLSSTASGSGSDLEVHQQNQLQPLDRVSLESSM